MITECQARIISLQKNYFIARSPQVDYVLKIPINISVLHIGQEVLLSDFRIENESIFCYQAIPLFEKKFPPL